MRCRIWWLDVSGWDALAGRRELDKWQVDGDIGRVVWDGVLVGMGDDAANEVLQ